MTLKTQASVTLEALVGAAKRRGASDLHLEPGMPATVRVRGTLEMVGPQVSSDDVMGMARDLLGAESWQVFLVQRSFDMSATLHGIRCRFNILRTSRGVGMAIRLLMPFRATVDRLNLHPDLKEIANFQHGLVLLSGPTGCGKSSTVAALIQEINTTRARHIITIESPIEHSLRSQLSLIRQREVGRDTPSFEQALHDALREDPDVIVVGEMRDAETMRLTLNAAETGHLVFATVHSSSVGEALQRVVGAFPAEAQGGISAQLADCIAAVVCQRLIYRPEARIRIPECEILFSSSAVKAFLRDGKFFKLGDVMQTSSGERMWTFARYRGWVESRSSWHVPSEAPSESDLESDEAPPASLPVSPPIPRVTVPLAQTEPRSERRKTPRDGTESLRTRQASAPMPPPVAPMNEDDVIEIDEDEDLDGLLRELDRKR